MWMEITKAINLQYNGLDVPAIWLVKLLPRRFNGNEVFN